MRGLGLEAELTPVEADRVNAIGRLRGSGGGKSLMFNGHIDTNPVTEGWTVDPWGGKVDDKFIYGIGVSNMKSGDAAYFCAVKTLIDAGVKLKGDVLLTYVVGELQGGVGTVAMVKQGYRADYFVNSEPTDLQALTMHAAAFVFPIELVGDTRHLSKREEAVDAIVAACDLVPRLNAMKFSGAKSPEHEKINRVHVGVLHGALGKELHEWRPPQVADYVKIKGSGRYAPGQTEEGALADLRAELDALERRHPGLKATVAIETDDRPGDDAVVRGRRGQSDRRGDQRGLSAGARREAADGRHHAARLLRHRRRASLSDGRDAGRRLRSGRALQHHAGRKGRHRRLPRHGPDLHPDDLRICG